MPLTISFLSRKFLIDSVRLIIACVVEFIYIYIRVKIYNEEKRYKTGNNFTTRMNVIIPCGKKKSRNTNTNFKRTKYNRKSQQFK